MKKLYAIVAAGFTAGTLDILAACIIYPLLYPTLTAKGILQSVSAGVYGKESADGNWDTALAGLALHFLIAMIWAVIFVLCFPFLKKIVSNKIVLGIVYGILIWIAMNYAVVPNSAIGKYPKLSWDFVRTPLSVLIIICCVGIPISVISSAILNERIQPQS